MLQRALGSLPRLTAAAMPRTLTTAPRQPLGGRALVALRRHALTKKRSFWSTLGTPSSCWENRLQPGKPHPSTCDCWDDLERDCQAAWAGLGWTRASWDEEPGSVPPLSLDQGFIDLTPEQQACAVALGYNESLWDDDESYQPQLPATPASDVAGGAVKVGLSREESYGGCFSQRRMLSDPDYKTSWAGQIMDNPPPKAAAAPEAVQEEPDAQTAYPDGPLRFETSSALTGVLNEQTLGYAGLGHFGRGQELRSVGTTLLLVKEPIPSLGVHSLPVLWVGGPAPALGVIDAAACPDVRASGAMDAAKASAYRWELHSGVLRDGPAGSLSRHLLLDKPKAAAGAGLEDGAQLPAGTSAEIAITVDMDSSKLSFFQEGTSLPGLDLTPPRTASMFKREDSPQRRLQFYMVLWDGAVLYV